jgi:hypothetical protein
VDVDRGKMPFDVREQLFVPLQRQRWMHAPLH